jgi:membrane associated rhomboid family serine protease
MDRAKSGLSFLILINVLVHLFRNDFRQHLHLHKTYRINQSNLSSMLLSIVYHMDPTHLLVNMLSLNRYGSEIFVHSSSRRWHSFFLVVASYVICGIGAFIFVELLSQYHEYQWEQRLQDARWRHRCNHWLCQSINDAVGGDVLSIFTDVWADWKTSFRFADVKLSMLYYRSIHRVGASGVVYGWMGMRVMTSWMSPHHSRMNGIDYFFLMMAVAHDLSKSPLSLEDLKLSTFFDEGSVDHSVHLMGFMFGMIWATLLITWEKVSNVGFGIVRWSGGGRRLGARWEEEQQRQYQDQQRRQNSRLIHVEDRNCTRQRTTL